jgi:hypothetical protein
MNQSPMSMPILGLYALAGQLGRGRRRETLRSLRSGFCVLRAAAGENADAGRNSGI